MISKVIDSLNAALKADPAAIQALVANRVPCNRALADHPTVQVGEPAPDIFMVGALGLINGVVEPLTGDRVAVALSDDGDGRIVAFVKYVPPAGETT
jgi:hypothetical protein